MLGTLKNLVTGGGKPKVTREQMLAAIPVRNTAVQWARETRDEDHPDVVLLRVPRRSDRFGNIVARLFKLPEFRKVELEEIGSDVWEMCDGVRTVEALTRAVCTKYNMNRRQAEASVSEYLKMLAERRLIALAVKKGTAAGAGPAKQGSRRQKRA